MERWMFLAAGKRVRADEVRSACAMIKGRVARYRLLRFADAPHWYLVEVTLNGECARETLRAAPEEAGQFFARLVRNAVTPDALFYVTEDHKNEVSGGLQNDPFVLK